MKIKFDLRKYDIVVRIGESFAAYVISHKGQYGVYCGQKIDQWGSGKIDVQRGEWYYAKINKNTDFDLDITLQKKN
jgi:hypothetical protein